MKVREEVLEKTKLPSTREAKGPAPTMAALARGVESHRHLEYEHFGTEMRSPPW